MMMSQVAQALGATLHGEDVMMTGVSKDTRDIHAGDLYVALKGERFDGHQFVAEASLSGAVAALVSDDLSLDVPQVQVADTRIALGQLAAHWRQIWGRKQCDGKLIGITGSNGKTSVKEMCSKILTDHAGASAVLATKGNLNNEIGLPMTLLELTEQHQFAVIEMGANHVGEINYLTKIARPDVALVNNAGPAHLEGFG
jgi:UDP-N-acetylmuramoyl-tripeptide--D-alanyl-D-alanine ligase